MLPTDFQTCYLLVHLFLYNFSAYVSNFYVHLCFRVCVWTSLFLILLGIFNACTVITRFTRVAGELFGMLITVLFFQEAIKVLLPLPSLAKYAMNLALQGSTSQLFDLNRRDW